MDSDAEVAAARIGRVIGGRYRLLRVLGIGGMAAVYEAQDPSGQRVAIKLLHPEMAARREVRERFVQEGTVAATIDHPGVVQTLPPEAAGDDGYLVMELLEGETLRARVQRHGCLPLDEVLDHAEQILGVLVAAHDKGVVHRDLKPDNLFVTPDGRVKILDFGLARVLDGVPGERRTRTGVALGTLAYMAPEQALGRRAEIDGRVDVFALGATMFRVLSGRRVHEAESEAELLMAMASRPAPPLASVAPDTRPGACAVVNLALAFSREARYPDSRTMLGDVRALRAGAEPPFATSRLASRDEATRADGPAPSGRTQPLGAREPAPSQRGGTVPLAAYGGAGAQAPPPGGAAPQTVLAAGMGAGPAGAADTAPMSARAAGRGRTEPLVQHPPAVAPGPGLSPSGAPPAGPASAPPVAGPGVPLAATSGPPPAVVAGAPPAVMTRAPTARRRALLPIIAVGGVSLALGIGITVWAMVDAGSSGNASDAGAADGAGKARAASVALAPSASNVPAPPILADTSAQSRGATAERPAPTPAAAAPAVPPVPAGSVAPPAPASAREGLVAAPGAEPSTPSSAPAPSPAAVAAPGTAATAPASAATTPPAKHFGRGRGRLGRPAPTQ